MPVILTASCFTSQSTLTVQNLVDYARVFPFTTSALGIAGYTDEPAVSFANDVMQEIMAQSNPWKWNAAKVTPFETQPYQQDYPTAIHQSSFAWLQSSMALDVNGTSVPRAMPPMTAVQALLPTFMAGNPSKISWIPNYMAQTGSWPGPSTLYVDPLVANGGGPSNNPLTAITDPNGNIQVLSAYGVTTSSPSGPSWPTANACPGTVTADGTASWTVMDPNDVAFRLNALATNNSLVWQILPVYQKTPPLIANLTDTFTPIPDQLNYLIKQGFLAFCYKQDDSNKFQEEFVQWQSNIQKALGSADRELTEFGFYPSEGIQSGSSGDGGSFGYGYPGWPGWSSNG